MPLSCAPYKPSTGACSWAATSIGCFGVIALVWPCRRPYHATPAFSSRLWAAYSQTIRPPQQKPVIPSLEVLPPIPFAQATAASRSFRTCASGVRWMISVCSLAMSE